MSSGADPDNYDEEPEEETGNASGGTASRDERESDALAARLAYECAWRRCDDALRTLRERRTITVAVLSLTLPAAGLVASLSTVGDRMNGASCISAVGWTVLAIAALCALLSAGRGAPTDQDDRRVQRGEYRRELHQVLRAGQEPDLGVPTPREGRRQRVRTHGPGTCCSLVRLPRCARLRADCVHWGRV